MRARRDEALSIVRRLMAEDGLSDKDWNGDKDIWKWMGKEVRWGWLEAIQL